MKKNNNKEHKIDFVICWVNGNDPNWKNKKNTYALQNNIVNSDSQFRDWGFLKYWFRSIEKNAPWVNKVFFVTDGQTPCFLNTNNKKLVIVNHIDFIPKQYLPTFSSHSIEINLHRIKQLSKTFVYFNDDMFLNKKISAKYFFKKQLPRYYYIERKYTIDDSFMGKISDNNIGLINKNFSRNNYLMKISKFINIKYGKYAIKNIAMINKKRFGIFEDDHLPCPFLKDTFEEIWKKEFAICNNTSNHKFRTTSDINQYVFKYYDLARGNFIPKMVKHGGYYLISGNNINDIIKDISFQIHPMICINDNSSITNDEFVNYKKQIVCAFEKKYPNKSTFEK